MPILSDLPLVFDVDAVLRGQGADPAIVRQRSPRLLQAAEQALQEGAAILQPWVFYKEFEVAALRHERIELAGGHKLAGKLLVQHLAQAKKVIVIVCTIGPDLDALVAGAWQSNPLNGLALDGVGSAAVEALANAACRHFEDQAAARGWRTSIPLSPGMIDWPVDEGQPQIFSLLDGDALQISLLSSFVMQPRKSLTMLLGAGPEMQSAGRTCDYCSLRETCRYQDHYHQ